VTNTGATTITGDVGLYSGPSITGFKLPPDNTVVEGPGSTGLIAGPGLVTGTIYITADAAQLAQVAVTDAYNALKGQTYDEELTGQNLGTLTLDPGVYWYSSSAGLTGTLTLDGDGDANAVWVFQIGTTLITASSSIVNMINDGQDCNVFWQVGDSATLDLDSTFIGNILALTSITLNTGANVSGRALAQNGAVTLDTNDVIVAVCAPTPTPTPTP
jgi:type VI secretion system secreted protein VgrG